MKSKPPNKRARLDPMPSSTSNSPKGNNASASGSGKASTAATASELLAAVKMKAAAAAVASGSNVSHQHQLSSSSSQMHAAYLSSMPFPSLSIPEWSKEFPKVSSFGTSTAVSGSEGIGIQIPMEDLDVIQSELETLRCSLNLRSRILHKSKECLKNMPPTTMLSTKALGEHYDPNHQEKINAIKNIMDSGHGTRTSVSAAAKLVMGTQLAMKTHVVPTPSTASAAATSIPPITGRKSNNSAAAAAIGLIKLDKQPRKKIKVEVGGKRNEKAVRGVQNRTHSLSQDDSTGRLEVPNQFWEFTETYCHNITTEDMDKLEKLIESHKTLPDGTFNIPPLGKYYRETEGSDMIRRYKNHDSPKAKTKDVCGPLTQRLVAALVDDRVNHYNHHSNGAREDSNDGFFINRPGLVKALGLDGGNGSGPSGAPLEARLRQVLLEQGLLNDEDPLASPDDEIMAEIKRTQNTLTKLHQYNSDKLKELHDMAKKELSRVSVKNELDKADKEVIEAYRQITSCRQKKKPLTKKEKDGASKALQCRKEALDKLLVVTDDASSGDV